MRTNSMSALRPTQNWSRTKEYRLHLFPLRDRAITLTNLKRKAESDSSEKPNRPQIKKDWKNNKGEQVYSLSPTPTSTPTSSNFLSVTLISLPWQEESVSMEGEALLDTSSLFGDFVSERLVKEYSLVPIVTANHHTVCSGLNNECVKISTTLLLRVTFFNEIVDKNTSFDIEATILKNTPIDLIISRNKIKNINFLIKFQVSWAEKISYQGGSLPLSVPRENVTVKLLRYPKLRFLQYSTHVVFYPRSSLRLSPFWEDLYLIMMKLTMIRMIHSNLGCQHHLLPTFYQ